MSAPLTPPGSPPEFRLVPPPADGLETAFRAAASRRRRKAATASGTGVAAALVAFAVLTGGSGQVLTQDPLPPADQAPGVLDVAPSDAATPEPLATRPTTTSAGARPDRAAPPSRPPAPPATSTASPATRPAVSRPVAARPAYRVGPMTRESTGLNLVCADAALCSTVYADGTEIEVGLCNPGAEPAYIDFAAQDEVDVAVRQGTTVVWRWGVGRPRVADTHQVTIAATECVFWTTPWKAVDQRGEPLPAGDYDLLATIDSADAGNAARATSSYTVR